MVTKEALMLLLVLGIVVSVLILGQLSSTQVSGPDPNAGYGRVSFNVKERPYDQTAAQVSFNVVERGEQ